MIEDYGVESSVWIGGKRIVLGINEENTEKPRYMSCIVTDNGLKDTACLTPKDMIPIDWHYSIKECTVAVKPEVLSEGCRNIGNQLYYIVGGFGAEANSRGSACYGWNLCRRKYERIERSEVMGIVPESLLPYVAKQTLEDIHHGFLTTDFEKTEKLKKRGEER